MRAENKRNTIIFFTFITNTTVHIMHRCIDAYRSMYAPTCTQDTV